MQIPIQLVVPSHTQKAIDTSDLIDSSAEISCIDQEFVSKYRLPTEKLASPIHAHNANHLYNKNGNITHTCTLYSNIKGIFQKVTFYVMACGRTNVILGLPWLRTTNPTIDWKS